MIKERNIMFRKVLIFADLCLVTGAFFIGYFLRNMLERIYPDLVPGQYLSSLNFYIPYLPILLFMWGSLLYYFGMYKASCVRQIKEVLTITFKTAVIGFILFGSYIFIFNVHQISRLFILLSFITAIILISLEKILLLYAFRVINKREGSFQSALIALNRILIVGTGKRASDLVGLIDKNPNWGVKIVGFVDKGHERKGQIINGHKVIGAFEDIPDIIHMNAVDEIVFIVPRSWLDEIEGVMLFCEGEGLAVSLAVDLFELKFSRAKQTDIYGFPLLTFESTPQKSWHLFFKRLFDFVASGIALVVLAPVLLILAILIKATSKGPVFFKQVRCGLYQRKFIFYKLRTMVVDAESRLKDLLQYNEMQGPVFKMARDPRITKVGKWLRKLSLDELPQLWNVFKGDMSLVGPRPPLPAEVENYDAGQRRKLSMRPGVTCLWQISGRSKISSFNEWMRLDLEYIDNWSLRLDLKILFKTIPVVLFGIGAE